MKLLGVCVLLSVTLTETSGFLIDRTCDVHQDSVFCSHHGDYHPCSLGDKCVCQPDWSGLACKHPTNCRILDCGLHGNCVSPSQPQPTVYCYCQPGFYGTRCQAGHDPCNGVVCVHGTCHASYKPLTNDFTTNCTCFNGYIGETCSELSVTTTVTTTAATIPPKTPPIRPPTTTTAATTTTKTTPTTTTTATTTSAPLVDGLWSAWSSWVCTKTCGSGVNVRTRTCVYTPGLPRGQPCPGDKTEFAVCSNQACPAGGLWSAWSTWVCTKTCGSGVNVRTRTCVYTPGLPRGQPCPGDKTEFAVCSNQACPVTTIATTTTTSSTVATTEPTNWGPWGVWSQCSASCGQSTRSRVRTCFLPSGQLCHGSFQEAEMCNSQACPLTSDWGSWKAWSPCSTTCGQSARIRTRSCDLPSGQLCHGSFQEAEICSTPACPYWEPFHDAGSCSVTCGTGAIQQERKCSTGNSQDCSGSAYNEKPCVLQECISK